MRKLLLSLLLAVPLMAFGQPTYDMTADVNYPDRKLQKLTFLQGATPKLRVYVEQKGSTYTNIGSDSMEFYYGSSGNASAFVIVTNSSVNTANGYFDFTFTAANLNTNGSFWYTALLKDSGGGMYYSGDGNLELRKTTVTGSPGAISLTTPLDWDGFNYSGGGSGPAIAGTGLTQTTNANGQLVLASDAASEIWNSGTNILIITNGTTRTIGTDGNLQTGINLNSATGATHTTQIAANVVTGAANTAAISTLDGQVIKKDGSVTWTGDDPHGGNSISGVQDLTIAGNAVVGSNVTATLFSTPSINVSTNITTVQALTQTEIGLENIGVYAKTQPSGAGPFRFYAWSGTDGGLAWYESTSPGVASDMYARWANPSYAGRYENGDAARRVTFVDATYALNVNSGDSYFGGDVTGASNLTVNGDANLPDLTVTNSLTLGDDLITNKISVSAVKLDSTWVPDTSNAYDIGSIALPVRDLFFASGTAESNITASGTIDGNAVTENSTNILDVAARAVQILDALPDDRPTFDYTSDGTTVTGIVNSTDLDGDFVMNWDSVRVTNTVPAYLTLSNGTTNSLQFQYIYATPNGITNSTTFPTGEFAMLFDLSLLDAAHTQSDGMFTLRRWTDKVSGPNGENRSMVQRVAERVRQEPSVWKSGGDLSTVITTQGGADDDIFLNVTSGTAYQMHKQSFSALTATNGSVEYHIINDPTFGINHITNLNQITEDASGNAVFSTANSWFNIAVLRHITSGTTNVIDGEYILNLSLNDYATQAGALADSSGNLVLTVPSDMVGETIVLGFITLNRTAAGGGTWTAQATSLLGTPVGGQGGGASSLPASSTFTDSAFKVIDDGDATRVIQLQAGSITAGNTRTMTVQDKDGTIAYNDQDETFAANVTVTSNLTVNGTVNGVTMSDVVTKVSTPVDNQIGVWTGDGTLEGDTELIWNGTQLGIGKTPDQALHVYSASSAQPRVLVENENADANAAEIRMYKNSTSPADNDPLGFLLFYGNDSLTNETFFSRVTGYSDVVLDGSEAGRLRFELREAGNLRDMLILTLGETVVNDESIDSDFRVESDNDANALFVQGSDGNVGIGTNTPSFKLDVAGQINLPMGQLMRWTTDATNYIEFGGLSSTQAVMRFVVDGVTSNTHFNLISE